MTVREAFTAKIESIQVQRPIQEAARRMRDAKVGLLVVLEGDRPIGVVTDRDLAVRAIAAELDPSVEVRVVMTTPVDAVREDAPIEEAVAAMRRGWHRRLLVVDAEGRPTGVISADDVLGRLAFSLYELGDLVEHENEPVHAERYVG